MKNIFLLLSSCFLSVACTANRTHTGTGPDIGQGLQVSPFGPLSKDSSHSDPQQKTEDTRPMGTTQTGHSQSPENPVRDLSHQAFKGPDSDNQTPQQAGQPHPTPLAEHPISPQHQFYNIAQIPQGLNIGNPVSDQLFNVPEPQPDKVSYQNQKEERAKSPLPQHPLTADLSQTEICKAKWDGTCGCYLHNSSTQLDIQARKAALFGIHLLGDFGIDYSKDYRVSGYEPVQAYGDTFEDLENKLIQACQQYDTNDLTAYAGNCDAGPSPPLPCDEENMQEAANITPDSEQPVITQL